VSLQKEKMKDKTEQMKARMNK